MGKVLPQYKVPPGDLPNIAIREQGWEVSIVILFYFIFKKRNEWMNFEKKRLNEIRKKSKKKEGKNLRKIQKSNKPEH